jgi:hypothetical protein
MSTTNKVIPLVLVVCALALAGFQHMPKDWFNGGGVVTPDVVKPINAYGFDKVTFTLDKVQKQKIAGLTQGLADVVETVDLQFVAQVFDLNAEAVKVAKIDKNNNFATDVGAIFTAQLKDGTQPLTPELKKKVSEMYAALSYYVAQ